MKLKKQLNRYLIVMDNSKEFLLYVKQGEQSNKKDAQLIKEYMNGKYCGINYKSEIF